MNNIRRQRIEKRILRLVADLYFRELKDPRFCTFTRCRLTPEGSKAEIHVSILGEEAEIAETINALRKARGFIQSKIGRVVRMQNVPTVEFIIDDSMQKAFDIQKKIDSM